MRGGCEGCEFEEVWKKIIYLGLNHRMPAGGLWFASHRRQTDIGGGAISGCRQKIFYYFLPSTEWQRASPMAPSIILGRTSYM